MQQQLRKLAARSAQLRNAALIKQSGIVGAALKGLGGVISHFPKASVGVGLTAALGTGGAVGKYRQYKAGFDPNVQSSMGQAPTPPGAT